LVQFADIQRIAHTQGDQYMFSSGGRYSRTVAAFARLFGYRGDRHVPLASVIEFIHTALCFMMTWSTMLSCAGIAANTL
jgi:geranylgeranyl pyrophosphate synthase